MYIYDWSFIYFLFILQYSTGFPHLQNDYKIGINEIVLNTNNKEEKGKVEYPEKKNYNKRKNKEKKKKKKKQEYTYLNQF